MGIIGIPNGAAMQTTAFEPDSTKPVLISFELDLTAEHLQLSFSETVNASSVDYTELVLQGAVDSNTHSRRLTPSTEYNAAADSDVLVLPLNKNDLNEIKRQIELGVSRNTSFIPLSGHFVLDMNANLLSC